MGVMKNFGGGANEKFPFDKFCSVEYSCHLWGGKGGLPLKQTHHDRYKIKQSF